LEEAIHYLAYKSLRKLSQQKFIEELNHFGVPTPPDYSQAYREYRNKRHARDLHGLENGDISTLFSLFEDKIDQFFNTGRSDLRDSIQ